MNNTQSWILIGFAAVMPLCRGGCGDNGCGINILNPTGVSPVSAGASEPLQNPCNSSGSWGQGDSFQLLNPPDGISVTLTRDAQANVTATLVAANDAPPLASQPVAYICAPDSDANLPSNVGAGTLLITTVSPLQVSATATPAKITAGQSSQLHATVTGGAPPFAFKWSDSSLDNIANPVAKPTTTTTYTVTVTDSTLPKGQTSSATTSVTVSAPASFILTVVNTNPDALGGVSDNQGLIASCFATTCSAAYPSGTTVVLATGPGAPPNWSGCNSVDSTKHCTVVMDAAKKVTVSP